MVDATFEDGAERPLALRAETAEDLGVISALVQDAVLPITEIRYDRRRRELALLLNRFRWEDRTAAEARKRVYERVQSVLMIGDVQGVASQGIDRSDRDTVLSVLSLAWEPLEDGTGRLMITLAGDGAISVAAECLDVTLKDVSRPYAAPSRKAPTHPD
ncbi:DUF2948 family protein [Defluviimonas sp. WL0002]|uniref:DUF2948 family protein n=1 Tax=Albidovulum marisflavi TaxID=2984159 RepID=A0ABT2ZGS2_9RHOB|nr:DUF2948 family protein [Defluviimonas sp. WL0002]MCV2870235.1 DUF2948 family protein [Defluviimonas sp. WL0002]